MSYFTATEVFKLLDTITTEKELCELIELLDVDAKGTTTLKSNK
ncbi:hypothetical protein [Neisseria sp. Ec49-e6-T10]